MTDRRYALIHLTAKEYEGKGLALDLCSGGFYALHRESEFNPRSRNVTQQLERMNPQNFRRFMDEIKSGIRPVQNDWEDYVFIGKLFWRMPVINMVLQESKTEGREVYMRKARRGERVIVKGINNIDFVGTSFTGTVTRNEHIGITKRYGTPGKLTDIIRDFFINNSPI